MSTTTTETEVEQQEQLQPQIDDKEKKEVQEYWDILNREANSTYKEELAYIMRNDEIRCDNEIYTLLKITPKKKVQYIKLNKESKDLDKESEEYYENLGKRACLLIKDMTMERYYDSDVEAIEKIVLAWGGRAFNGFRKSVDVTTKRHGEIIST